MHIVVFTRSTPDTAARLSVGPDGAAHWGEAATVVNPWDEYALEEALVQAKATGGRTTAIAVGPELHTDALRTALAMGFDEAVRVDDAAYSPSDPLHSALLAAAAVRRLGDVQLVLFGRESVDMGTDAHQVQTARKLGWPLLSAVSRIVALDAEGVRVERSLEQGRETVRATLPAALTVLKGINEPRYPSFMGIRKAAKKDIPVWDAAALGVALPPPRVRQHTLAEPPKRDVETVMIAGGTPQDIARQLVDRLLDEKVL